MTNFRSHLLAATTLGVFLIAPPAAARTIQISFNATDFSDPLDIDNVYFPLIPGTVFTYKGETPDGCEVVVTSVTGDTRTIAGVTTRVVHDTAYESDTCTTDASALVEDTLDYYAQDNSGNVWYFGEDSFHCPIFTCDPSAGSWIAGVAPAGALPGIIMPAQPRNGDTYFQERAAPVALDQATVKGTGVTVVLKREDAYPPGTFTNCIVTKEFSTLENGANEQKSYCPGIGNVAVDEHHGKVFRSELTGVSPDALRFRTVPGN
ncbi:hypothetical protein LZ518_01960 [Sphingomonas sp. RB56-2]|uniref:Uncharacterized protein n=1 Tax=Sphingomonas brevis TaxID=2908206 RepID=A0ABT0S6I0_9SPHN|nr:hypothetical protein [Sphingomonas brevis]MCL6739902.1 hypothetical protein [Sphingomonas brevis]